MRWVKVGWVKLRRGSEWPPSSLSSIVKEQKSKLGWRPPQGTTCQQTAGHVWKKESEGKDSAFSLCSSNSRRQVRLNLVGLDSLLLLYVEYKFTKTLADRWLSSSGKEIRNRECVTTRRKCLQRSRKQVVDYCDRCWTCKDPALCQHREMILLRRVD